MTPADELSSLADRAVIVLWASGEFDTADIADVLDREEADVLRLVRTAREVARELGLAAPAEVATSWPEGWR